MVFMLVVLALEGRYPQYPENPETAKLSVGLGARGGDGGEGQTLADARAPADRAGTASEASINPDALAP